MLNAVRAVTLVVLTATVMACASPQGTHPISVCDVLAAPETFDGERVSIRGVVRTDYFEYSGLADARCSRRVISFGPETHVRGGLQEMLTRLQEVRNRPEARVELTVDGVIDHRPGEVPFLIIDEMYFSDVEVVPWTESAPPQ
jgi:hypothetical protein